MPQAPGRELAFELFPLAYEHQMRGELDKAIELYRVSGDAG